MTPFSSRSLLARHIPQIAYPAAVHFCLEITRKAGRFKTSGFLEQGGREATKFMAFPARKFPIF
jgi:hypothetical protein